MRIMNFDFLFDKYFNYQLILRNFYESTIQEFHN